MARIRSIKPELFLNDELAALPPITRLLFIGLWTQADREGRMHDRPVRLKASLLPYDRANVDAMLDALADAGFIVRYQDGDERYIQVVNFERHQVPNIKERESEIPLYDASTMQARCKHGASTPLYGREGKGTISSDSDIESDFAEWYRRYPRKEGRGYASKAYRSARSKADAQTLLAALDRSIAYWQREERTRKTTPLPATWLNQERWTDEYDDKPSSQLEGVVLL